MDTLPAIANPVNNVAAAAFELFLIREGAKARGLNPAGRELLPVKEPMLRSLPPDMVQPCLSACEMLFAAILSHEDGLIAERRSEDDAIGLVTSRVKIGTAEATCAMLFHGPVGQLLAAAAEAAPIAFYAMARAAPKLGIIDRLRTITQNKSQRQCTNRVTQEIPQ